MSTRVPSVDMDPEKKVEAEASESIASVENKDEALKLVGLEKTVTFTDEQYRKLRRKLDLILTPLCASVYLSQYLDKNVLNYASVMGLPIHGQNYNLSALGFFIGFLVWVFPTMYISQKLRLGKYLGANVMLWGVVMMLHAVPETFGPFFFLRFILGMLESCVAPILILIIGMFYTKGEQATRISWFYLTAGVAAIIGGTFSYGISFATEASIMPWKILYLLTGAIALLCGIAVTIWMPDSPVHAVWLTQEERIMAIERVRADQGGIENKTIKRYQIVETLTDVRTWLIVLLTFVTSIPQGGLSSFSNFIIKGFGYTSQQALILTTPVGGVEIVSVLFIGWLSDHTSERMLPIALANLPTIVGAALLVGVENTPANKGVLLFGTYIACTYIAAIGIIYAWNASNTSGHTKKVTINAMTLAAWGLGNIVGAEIFLPQNAPLYIPGKTVILVMFCISFLLCFVLRLLNERLNAKKRKGIQELKEKNNWTDEDIERERQRHAFLDLTDRENPYFVYMS